MPIVVNGTTIPTNVANALNVNGVNITSVVCNGVPVWAQSLFNALWSGNSNAVVQATQIRGLNTLGASYRCYSKSFSDYYGTWQTVSMDGNFSGDSSVAQSLLINTSGNLLRTAIWYPFLNRWEYAPTWVTFTKANKAFTGSSVAYVYDEIGWSTSFTTSGGLMRVESYSEGLPTAYGTYISLT